MNDTFNSMVTPIRSIMLRHPREAFVSQAYLEEVWPWFTRDICLCFSENSSNIWAYDSSRWPKRSTNHWGGNVLTLSPKICVATAGNPRTAEKLRDVGIELFTYPGKEISLKGTGGPTCLTCPILRLGQ